MSQLSVFICPNEKQHDPGNAHCSICGDRICELCEYVPPENWGIKSTKRFCKNHYFAEDTILKLRAIRIECANEKCRSIIDWHKILVDLDERKIKYEPRIWYDHITDFDNYQYEIIIKEKK